HRPAGRSGADVPTWHVLPRGSSPLLPRPPTGLADGFGREGRPTAITRGLTPGGVVVPRLPPVAGCDLVMTQRCRPGPPGLGGHFRPTSRKLRQASGDRSSRSDENGV